MTRLAGLVAVALPVMAALIWASTADARKSKAKPVQLLRGPIVELPKARPLPPQPAPPGSGKPAEAGVAATTAKPDTKTKAADTWSDSDIAAAKAECLVALKGMALDMAYVAPIKHGACGAPQPIELRGFGESPKVAVEPAAVMNCKMAAAFVRWFDATAQPQARALLKSPIVRLRNAAAYDCRNRYGDPSGRLSEHAHANAIDVAAFVAENGKTVAVGESWGPVLRDLIAEAKEKKAKAARPVVIANAGAAAGFATTVLPTSSGVPGAVVASVQKTGHGSRFERQARLDEAAALGIVLPKPATPSARFAHIIHASACSVFGTVLGPEANDAHRDHFHFDLAPRSGQGFCE